jgi:hypothetical protein
VKCRDCGQEGFANIGEVTRHKGSECPGKVHDAVAEGVVPADKIKEAVRATVEPKSAEPASIEAIQRMAGELGIGVLIVKESRFLVIPKRFLPDEVKYLGKNAYMGVKMRGYLQDEGLVVQEPTERIR